MKKKVINDSVRRSPREPKKRENSIPPSSKRKRKIDSSSDKQPKTKKKSPDGREIDSYCWICHKIGQEKICNTCPRVYHVQCIKKDFLKFNDLGCCTECQAKSVSGYEDIPKLSLVQLKELLGYTIAEALGNKQKSSGRSQVKESEFKKFKTWPFSLDNNKLCQVIDLDGLIDKMNDEDSSYSSTAKFFSDVKWIYHNCCISYGTESEITAAALKLQKYFKLELVDIEACAECYTNNYLNKSFISLCEKPHQIVWAKVRGSPYWPAKCLKIFKGFADVRFFGTHDKANVQLNNCYKISQRSPNDRPLKQNKYMEALCELSAYVEKYKKKFCTFPFAAVRTPLTGTKSKIGKKNSRKGSKPGNESSCAVPTEYDLPRSIVVCDKLEMGNYNSTPTVITDVSENVNVLHKPGCGAALSASVCITMASEDEVSAGDSPSNDQSESQQQSEDYTGNFSDLSMSQSTITLSPPTMFETDTNTTIRGLDHSDTEEISNLSEHTKTSMDDQKNKYVSDKECVPVSFKNKCDCTVSAANSAQSDPEILVIDSTNYDINNEDEVKFIGEVKRNFESVNALAQDSELMDAFCKILLKNHPTLKEFYDDCQEFGMRSFLRMWLSYHLKGGENEVSIFCSLYKKIEKSTNNMKDFQQGLEDEIKQLKEENINLKNQNTDLETIAAQRGANTNVLLKTLRLKYERCSEQESKLLADEKIQAFLTKKNSILLQKENELVLYQTIIEELKCELAELESIEKECQTEAFSDTDQTEESSSDEEDAMLKDIQLLFLGQEMSDQASTDKNFPWFDPTTFENKSSLPSAFNEDS